MPPAYAVQGRWSLLLVIVVGIALALSWRHGLPPSSFKAFYCAGRVIDEHGDPYRVEPLRSCEHEVAPGVLPSYAVEPAPLPGYVISPFALAAKLPYRVAHGAYVLLCLCALLGIGIGLAVLTRAPALACTLAVLAMWFVNVQYGELPPFATAGVVLAAYALLRDRPWLAAAGAVLAATEPHLALPVWASLLLFAPRTRVPVVVCGCALLALDLTIGGTAQAIAYFAHVLPLQALSEVHANDQFSLTHQLSLLGVPDRAALMLGSICYAVMLSVGLLVAARIARARSEADYLALVPPAFVLFGGTFVHDVQFMAALPLAVVALARFRNVAFTFSALLLCIAWGSGAGRLGLVMSLLSAAAIVWLASRGNVRNARYAWSAAALLLVAIAVAINLHRVPVPATLPAPALGGDVWSPVAWQQYLEASPDRTQPHLFDIIRKLPEWAGLLVLLGATLYVSASVEASGELRTRVIASSSLK